MTGPRAPAVVKWAARAMLAGAVLSAVLGAFQAMRWANPSGDIRSIPPVLSLVIWILLVVPGAVPWLWMARMVLAGRGWARICSTVFFGLYFLVTARFV